MRGAAASLWLTVELWRNLFRHFVTGLDADITQTLGLVAAPGAFFILLSMPLRFVGWDLVFGRYLFLSLSMILMGIVVVIKWDALFPDRTDFLVLTPLPVRLPVLVLAKGAALVALLAIFLADVNFFATLLWPALDGSRGTLSIWTAHAVSNAAAGLFAALAVLALEGLLNTIFSGRALRRVSVAAQTLLMALLVMMFFLSPLLGMALRDLARRHSPLIYWFPAYWFAGLYERLRPATGDPVLLSLSGYAVGGLAVAVLLFILLYAASYRRHARRVLESFEPPSSGAARRSFGVAADRFLLRTPVERAVFHFIGQTIVRSARHRLFLAVYAGFGAALAILSFGSGPSGLLRLPLTLSFVLVSGLRAAFNFPCDLSANWVFRISEANWTRECAAGARKWVLACGIVPLFLLFAPVEFASVPWTAALFHLAFGTALSTLVAEALFATFRKVPFTCSYLAGKVNVVGLSVVYIFGFTLYSRTMAGLEQWLERSPGAAAAFLGAAAAGWAIAGRRRAPGAAVEFEDSGDPAVQVLGIGA